MKKLLSLIGSISLIGGTGSTIIACKHPENQKSAELNGSIESINLFTKLGGGDQHSTIEAVTKTINDSINTFSSLINAIKDSATSSSDKSLIKAENLKVDSVYQANRSDKATDEDLTDGAVVYVKVIGADGSNINGSVMIKDTISKSKIGLAQDALNISSEPVKVPYTRATTDEIKNNVENFIGKIDGPGLIEAIKKDATGNKDNLSLDKLKFDKIYSDEKLEKEITNDDIKDGATVFVKVTPKPGNDDIVGYSYFKIVLQEAKTILPYAPVPKAGDGASNIFQIKADISADGALEEVNNAVNNAITQDTDHIITQISNTAGIVGDKNLIKKTTLQEGKIYTSEDFSKEVQPDDVRNDAKLYAKIIGKNNEGIVGYVYVLVEVTVQHKK